MFGVFEVKGEATDASCSDKEMPTWAIFKAWKQRVSLLSIHTLIHLSWGYMRKACQASHRVACGPSTSQEMTRFLLCLLYKKKMALGHLAKEVGNPEPYSSPSGLYQPLSHCASLVKPSQTLHISFSIRKNGGSVYPRNIISKELQASTIKCKSWSVLMQLWPRTLAATYPTVIGPVTAHSYKVTKRESCQM